MEKVFAHSDFTITVDCPYCNEYLDLTDKLRDSLDPEEFLRAHDINEEIKCPKCGKTFIVESIEF